MRWQGLGLLPPCPTLSTTPPLEGERPRRLRAAHGQEAGTESGWSPRPLRAAVPSVGVCETEQHPPAGWRGLGQRQPLTEAIETTGQVPAKAQASSAPASCQHLERKPGQQQGSLGQEKGLHKPVPLMQPCTASVRDFLPWAQPQPPVRPLGDTRKLHGCHQCPGGCKHSSQ